MKPFRLFLPILGLALATTHAEVRVFVEPTAGVAYVRYECTAGERIRAFALNATVDQGAIVDISDYFVGPSRADAQGYGIFPASMREHIDVGSGTGIDWQVPGYNPLAFVADNPANTLPGLGSTGVTLEFGALWDPAVPASVPGASGTLCALHLSQDANVALALNATRGGVISATTGSAITPTLSGAFVDVPSTTDPLINTLALEAGVLTIQFEGGELEWSDTVDGGWQGTGDSDGVFSATVETNTARFYRVRQ